LAEPQPGQAQETPQGSLGISTADVSAATDKVLELARNRHEY
jgi:hypothetical protein